MPICAGADERVSPANRQLDTNMLISVDMLHEIKPFVRVRPLAPIELKGKSGEHTLYEVLDVR
jgi:hypothetical protein